MRPWFSPVVFPERTVGAALIQRRSTRSFDPSLPVSDQLLEEALADAVWAPSPHNSQPWRFVSLTSDARSRLAMAMGEALGRDLRREQVADASIRVQIERSHSRICNAPAALLCCLVDDGLRLSGNQHQDYLERQMAVQSVGAVLQSLFLAAWERGLGTCWMAAPMYCQAEVRAVLDLPGHFQPQALALVGYPTTAGRPRTRHPVRSFILKR